LSLFYLYLDASIGKSVLIIGKITELVMRAVEIIAGHIGIMNQV